MEEIAEIVREIGRQQTDNSYYRTCYGLLKQLQDLVAQSSDDLRCLQQYETLFPSNDFLPIHHIAAELQNSVAKLLEQEKKSHSAWQKLRSTT
ncbi:hypothetical protein PITC_058540 [Penicillium italicum]|uniref:Uncharacterized protein n=1 Tax=Penicillium italicum TaxID=40296 RepID=A0A0A2L4R6_PENIT|nr:hypothetical protein PITC_058540 [Penicillium italicum]